MPRLLRQTQVEKTEEGTVLTTLLEKPKFPTRWFCETCMETTPHKRIFTKLRRQTLECLKCGEQFTRNYDDSKWSHRKRKWKYRYEMRCTHVDCGYEWNTKRLRQPERCPRCKRKHIVIVGLTSVWRKKREGLVASG